ncbi:MAG: hypothetical protein JSV04_04990 [Candidatus Heimdallarchaeota archaeon]|nr:MAG: hypothetical protein JSV04_04990 [Candidatus Heimdallarchaeota archaeon]
MDHFLFLLFSKKSGNLFLFSGILYRSLFPVTWYETSDISKIKDILPVLPEDAVLEGIEDLLE